MALLDIRDLSLGYGKDPSIMEGVSFSIHPGEIIALTGNSGTGKTSLLHTIACILEPRSGDLLFEDKNITDFSQKEKNEYLKQSLGLVFQAFHLIPHLSVEDNVSLPLLFAKVDNGKEKVTSLLEKTGLAKHAHKKASELSGGQQQRVAIVRALVTTPRLILADEPTGNLDTDNGQAVMELFTSLAKNEGAAVLYVTHENPYLHYADRVLEMKGGKLLEKGK